MLAALVNSSKYIICSSMLQEPVESCNGVGEEGKEDAGSPGELIEAAAAVASRALEQRSWRVHELIESEKDYVSDLWQCCQYIYYMRASKEQDAPDIPMPEDLKQGKDRMIFGNLEMIYEWHRE